MTHYIASSPGVQIGKGTGQPGDGLPGTGTSGPRGVEAVIEYNGLYLNVRDWIDTFLVTQIAGIDDADVRDSRELNPGYHGEQVFKGYYGGRTIVLSGKVITKTLFKLRDMQVALRQAFADLSVERPLVFRANSPDLDMQIYCKKSQQIQMAEEQRTANHFERSFQVTLRASNPRFTGLLVNRGDRIFAAATYNAIAFTLINNGNFSAQPLIEMTGPIASGLTITNEANGDYITLTGAVPGGEKWVLDSRGRRMYRASDSANRFQYLDVNSSWPELTPYLNPIKVVATGMTAGTSRLTYSYYHTYM